MHEYTSITRGLADRYFSTPRINSAHSTAIVDNENDALPRLSAASNRASDPQVCECVKVNDVFKLLCELHSSVVCGMVSRCSFVMCEEPLLRIILSTAAIIPGQASTAGSLYTSLSSAVCP